MKCCHHSGPLVLIPVINKQYSTPTHSLWHSPTSVHHHDELVPLGAVTHCQLDFTQRVLARPATTVDTAQAYFVCYCVRLLVSEFKCTRVCKSITCIPESVSVAVCVHTSVRALTSAAGVAAAAAPGCERAGRWLRPGWRWTPCGPGASGSWRCTCPGQSCSGGGWPSRALPPSNEGGECGWRV